MIFRLRPAGEAVRTNSRMARGADFNCSASGTEFAIENIWPQVKVRTWIMSGPVNLAMIPQTLPGNRLPTCGCAIG